MIFLIKIDRGLRKEEIEFKCLDFKKEEDICSAKLKYEKLLKEKEILNNKLKTVNENHESLKKQHDSLNTKYKDENVSMLKII